MNIEVHATSADGVHWTLSDPPKAYSRRLAWGDGVVTVQGSLERPQLLFEDGEPRYLFAATGDATLKVARPSQGPRSHLLGS